VTSRFRKAASRAAFNLGIALTALRVNLMRSILTTLGVSIGVFAVVLAVAVGSGAQVSVMGAINSLGSNMAIVFPVPDDENGGAVAERGRLTMRDAIAIERQVEGVTAIAPQLHANVQIVSGGRNASTEAIGVTPTWRSIATASRMVSRPRDRARPHRGHEIVRRL
jgi:putative ABC transport system permease protein